MKKMVTILMIINIMLVIGLCGCSSNEKKAEGTTEIQYADDDFIKALRKGLEARWSIEEPEEYDYGSEEHKKYYTSIVDAEIEAIESFSNKKFKDSKLQEKALKYINMIKQQKEALDYLGVDSEKYEKLWGEAYDERTKLIVEFYQNYGLIVSDKYEDTIKQMTTNAQIVEKNEETEKQVQDIMANIKFEKNKEKSDGYSSYYAAIVENTTDVTFEYFGIDINLFDKEDVILESTQDSVENWKPGTKARFEFFTSEKFNKYAVEQAELSISEE